MESQIPFFADFSTPLKKNRHTLRKSDEGHGSDEGGTGPTRMSRDRPEVEVRNNGHTATTGMPLQHRAHKRPLNQI
jgi:hypothetical protein